MGLVGVHPELWQGEAGLEGEQILCGESIPGKLF